MITVHVTDRARSDLDEIWFYVALDSIERADRLLDAILAKCSKLQLFPEMGPLA